MSREERCAAEVVARQRHRLTLRLAESAAVCLWRPSRPMNAVTDRLQAGTQVPQAIESVKKITDVSENELREHPG